jgi:putative aldouronate transport system substrate-binding protein
VPYLNNGNFIGAFDIIRGTYLDGDTVKYGAVEPGYKEFLAEFSKWYSEGLIDKNISNLDGGAVSNNILNGKSGATIAFAGSGIGSWMKSAEDIPGFKLSAVPYPVMNKGDKPKFGQRESVVSTSGAAAITESCKNPELAARFLDYGYSEEGHNLFNFGIEGESFNIKDGYPTYSDAVMKNPNNLSIANAIAQYARASYFGPFVQDKAYIEQFYELPEQKNALVVWADTDAAKTKLPPVALSPEESSEIANIMNNIDTYIDEYSLAKIMNVNKNDDFASFVEQVNKYGLPRVIEIYQGAYERYKSR